MVRDVASKQDTVTGRSKPPLRLLVLAGAAASLLGAAHLGQLKDMQGFLNWVKQSLPEHSAMPPVAELATAATPPASINKAWEHKYENMEGLIRRKIGDFQPEDSSSPGSLALDTKELVGAVALPAQSSFAVVIGRVASDGQSHLATNRHFVYCTYAFNVMQVLKSEGKEFMRNKPSVDVVLFGGGLRYPSGYLEYFIIHGNGFMEQGKQYVLFLWKPYKKMIAFNVAAAYLLEGGVVYQIAGDSLGAFNGTSVTTFEAAVKSAISDNVDR
jgi:hypothetical protein